MKKHKPQVMVLYLAFLILFLLGAVGCISSNTKAVTPEEITLVPDPKLVTGKLPNGLSYYLYENPEPAQRVSMHMAVRAGSFQETGNQQGLAHFLEHMVFNGSTHFKPGELVKYFQNLGMDFGGDANAHTGFFETVYDLNLSKGDADTVEEALVVFQDYAEGALLLPEEIEREKAIVLAEKRTRDSVSYRTFTAKMKATLPGSRISERFPIGKADVIGKADREALKGYYDTWYRPENISLVMVGDFNAEKAREAIIRKFSGMMPRAEKALDPPIGNVMHKGVVPFYHHESEAGDTRVSIEAVRIVPHESDSPGLQRRLLKRYLAGMIMQNRLESIVLKGNSPFEDAYIHSGPYFRELEFSKISAGCPPEKWGETMAILESELRRGLLYGFTASELARVKADYLADLQDAVATVRTRDSGDIASGLLYTISMDRVYTSAEFDLELYGPMVNSLGIEEVNKAFRDCWSQDHRILSVTGNARITSEKPGDAISGMYEKSMAASVTPPVERGEVVFPYEKAPSQPGKIVSRHSTKDLGITTVVFENGVRLNLKKTDFKADEITFNLLFGRGKSGEPAEKPGLSLIAPMVINASGVGKLSADDLELAFTGKRTYSSFDVRETGFRISGGTVNKEVSLLFQLLRAQITDYSVRNDAMDLSLRKLEKKFKGMAKSVEGTMALSGYRYLAGGDSRFGFPPFAKISAYTTKDIRDWVDSELRGSEQELSVVGDFDPGEIIREAALYIGTLPPSDTLSSGRDDNPVFPGKGSVEFLVDTRLDRALVGVAFPTDDFWNIRQTRRLSILAEVFSERMREIIREKLGAAYSASAYNYSSMAYQGYGILNTFVPVSPADAHMVVDEIKQIALDLRRDGITEDELKRSLGPVIVGLKEQVRSNEYWLNSVMTGMSRNPERLEWSRSILGDFSSVTRDEISLLAGKFLDTQKAVTIVIKPAPRG